MAAAVNDRDAVEKFLSILSPKTLSNLSHEGGNILVYIYPITAGFIKLEIRDKRHWYTDDQMLTLFDRFSKKYTERNSARQWFGPCPCQRNFVRLHGSSVSVSQAKKEKVRFSGVVKRRKIVFDQHNFDDQPQLETIPSQVPLSGETEISPLPCLFTH